MANSKKVSKGLNSKTKSKVILGVCIALLILIVGGYFVYYTGLPARIIPAVKIVETVDGKEKTIGKIYTPELTYYKNQILSMYAMYGMDSETYLGAVNEATGKTNNQLMLDSAAEQIVSIRYVCDMAKKDPNFISGANRYAEYELYMADLRADNNNFPTVGQFLAAQYGSGMTPSVYVNIMKDQAMAQEYQEYLKQTAFVPSDEEIQAIYDENPDMYMHLDYNWFYFSKEAYTDHVAAAEAVKAAAGDSVTFNTEVYNQMGEDIASATGFSIQDNTTYVEGITKAEMTSNAFPEEMNQYLLNPDNQGKAEVFTTENGSYVVLPVRVYQADDLVYCYRKIVLNNVDVGSNDTEFEQDELLKGIEKTEKKANDLIATITDEESFIKAVKENTENYDDIATAGYVNGVLTAQFTADAVSENDKKLGEWLLDPNRKHGDMIAIKSYSNRMVYIYYYDEAIESWKNEIRNQIISEKASQWSVTDASTSSWVPQINYDVADKLAYYAS